MQAIAQPLDITKAMNQAKIHLLSLADQVFLSHVMCRTKHIIDAAIPTAGTDGVDIMYNPKFFTEHCKCVEERAGLVVHELLHIILEHPIRFKEQGLNHHRANRAADYYINLLIDKIDGVKLPEGGLLDKKYEGWSFREIYDDLDDDDKPAPMDDLLDPGSNQQGKSADDIKQELDQILVEANQAAEKAGNNPGNIPGEVRRYIDDLLNPKVPWFRILRRHMSEYAKTEYSMQKPNRRFFPEHYLPTLHGEAICDIASSVDTSGSVSPADFQAYVSENVHIMQSLKPKRLHFLQFDTKIKAHDVCQTKQELLDVEFKGYGGTNIQPVMQWAEEKKPKLLLVFTDGFFRKPTINPGIPVYWIIVGNPKFTAPFGRVIHYTPPNQQNP